MLGIAYETTRPFAQATVGDALVRDCTARRAQGCHERTARQLRDEPSVLGAGCTRADGSDGTGRTPSANRPCAQVTAALARSRDSRTAGPASRWPPMLGSLFGPPDSLNLGAGVELLRDEAVGHVQSGHAHHAAKSGPHVDRNRTASRTGICLMNSPLAGRWFLIASVVGLR